MLFIADNIVLHHSGGPNNQSLRIIEDYHVQKREMKTIAYHYIIGAQSGAFKIYNGRPIIMKGEHCTARNKDSVGICILGNYDKNPLPFEARCLLVDLCTRLVVRWGMDPLAITGHQKWKSNTICPGKYVMREIPLIQQEIKLLIPMDEYYINCP